MASFDNRAVAASIAAAIGDFLVAATIQLAVFVAEENNAGAVPAPIDTGELRASLRATVGGFSSEQPNTEGPFTNVSAAEIRQAAQLGALSPGDLFGLTWIADHAVIIEGGRRADKNGRMIGSNQAPDGWVDPLGIDAATAKMDTWKHRPSAETPASAGA